MEFHRHPDWQLWLLAFGFALLTAGLALVLLVLMILRLDWGIEIQQPPKADESNVATLYLEPVTQRAKEAKPQQKPFARTSADQPESTEKTNERIGERSTRATSDREADATAPALPSQYGIEPRDAEIETTESQYQDGELTDTAPLSPAAQGPPSSASSESPLSAPSHEAQSSTQNELQNRPLEIDNPPEAPPIDESEPTLSEERSLPPSRETLLQGPETVEVDVPLEEGDSQRPRETPQHQLEQSAADVQPRPQELAANPASMAAQPKPKTFRGNQRKTAVIGSISRTGRSALNVDDTELGRYQAAISKAVELEWQRNCMRYRDYIIPGFMTVHFYVESTGRVRSQKLVGEMVGGEVQKGFTLSSIRDAEIPAMPKELAEAYEGETLELVFRFYFD